MFGLNQQVVLASGNKGKLIELQKMLSDLGIVLIAQPTDLAYEVAETGTTFVENAIIKARHASALSGLPCIADDSGLVIDALGGAPGVKTARYAGSAANSMDNMNLLLKNLSSCQQAKQRQATFVCVLVFLRSAQDPLPIIATGQWCGLIHHEKLGQHGFGYDPLFWDISQQMTAAQMTAEQKAALSHRAQACGLLKEQLSHLCKN